MAFVIALEGEDADAWGAKIGQMGFLLEGSDNQRLFFILECQARVRIQG